MFAAAFCYGTVVWMMILHINILQAIGLDLAVLAAGLVSLKLGMYKFLYSRSQATSHRR